MMASQPRVKPLLRFSIAALLFLMLCLGGYLSGYRAGYDVGLGDAEDAVFVQKVYPVADLLPSLQSPSTTKDYDVLIDQIVSMVAPTSWMENGTGDGELQPFPSNGGIVVSQSQANHKVIAALLEQMRNTQEKGVSPPRK
jgi:hypothetical protein